MQVVLYIFSKVCKLSAKQEFIDVAKSGKVLARKCKKCGEKVIPLRDAIKCTECNWIDERKLSSNFGKNNFVKLGE